MARRRKSGFTLLESLVAFAIVSLVAGTAYLSLASSYARQAHVMRNLEMARLARALLTEYSATWPAMADEGVLGERFFWLISDTPMAQQSNKQAIPQLRKIEITVRESETLRAPFRMSTVFTRIEN